MPTRTDARSAELRGTARVKLLEAATRLIRARGLSATSVDAICAEAGVTKGAFFHNFKSKDELAIAAAEHWSQTTGALFEGAEFHAGESAAERVLGYVDLRAQLIGEEPAEYACLVGTMVQEAFGTNPSIREACGASILGHAATLEADIAEALADAGVDDVDPAGLARHTQSVIQGAFILGKASNDPQVARDSVGHLRRYLKTLLEA